MASLQKENEEEKLLSLTGVTALRLEPFYYQVGGHFLLMRMPETYVCKPRGKRESHFYETIPKCLKPFVPHYYGVVSVLTEVVEENGGHDKGVEGLDESSPIITHKVCSTVASSTTTNDVLDTTIDKDREIFRPLHKLSEVKVWSTQEQQFVPENGEAFHNPWTDSRFQALNTALKDNHVYQQDYIVLEDITRQFKCPCVTDIKIGTRCHGDISTPERIKRQESRDRKNVTASSMGVRFAGKLVYDKTKQCYRYMTRHIGQRLSNEEFYENLKSFLHNGQSFRLEVAQELIKRFQELIGVIQQLDSYRFFSCSLLVVYEGHTTCTSDTTKPLIDVRLIDFEKATHSGYTFDPVKYDGPDEGALTGLTTLIHLLEKSLGKEENPIN